MEQSKPTSVSEFPVNGKSIVIKRHTVFGWNVFEQVFDVGAVMRIHTTTEVPRSRCATLGYYSSGLWGAVVNGQAWPNRTDGAFSVDFPPYPVGIADITALEKGTLWCFTYKDNAKALPKLTPVRLSPTESHTFTAGQLVFVMEGRAGELQGPCTFVPETDTQLTADTKLHAFVIADAR